MRFEGVSRAVRSLTPGCCLTALVRTLQALTHSPDHSVMRVRCGRRASLRKLLRQDAPDASGLRLGRFDLPYPEHDLSHRVRTFFCSPFDSTGVLTLDATGEAAPRLRTHGDRARFRKLRANPIPPSLR